MPVLMYICTVRMKKNEVCVVYCVNSLSSKVLEEYMPQVWCVCGGGGGGYVTVCRLTRLSHTLHDLSGMSPVEAR